MGTVTEYGVAVMTVTAAYPDAPPDWVDEQARRALADADFYHQLVLRVERTARQAISKLEARVNGDR